MGQEAVLKNKMPEVSVRMNSGGLSIDATAMLQLIADRAYQLFDLADRIHGHDVQHWLQAEAELFGHTALNIVESPRLLVLLVLVPGFAPSELRVELEPRRVTILGLRHSHGLRDQSRKDAPSRRQRLFRMAPLPVEIDIRTARARLIRSGILELAMKKAGSAKSS